MLLALILAAAIAVTPDTIVWKDGPPTLPKGSKIAILEGDPKAEGIFTMRVRVPAGASLAPHWHPRDERVTILSGAVELGFGTTPDKAKTQRYGAGSFYVNPPRVLHYLYFPEETVMQMTGVGPWEIVHRAKSRGHVSSNAATAHSMCRSPTRTSPRRSSCPRR